MVEMKLVNSTSTASTLPSVKRSTANLAMVRASENSGTSADVPEFSDARTIAKFAVDLFTEGKVDAVDVLFTNFISTINQKPDLRQLLPIGEIKGVEASVSGENEGQELAPALRFRRTPRLPRP